MRALLVLCVATLVIAAPAPAGGWATAGLQPPPGGLGAGDTWNAEVTILQHGQTPLVGVQPAVIITNAAGDRRTFAAKPTGKPGVYRAEVTFPSEGTWRYAVNDGFTQYGGAQTHTFAPVNVGPGSGDTGWSPPAWTIAAAAALAALALVFAFARRLRPAPATATR